MNVKDSDSEVGANDGRDYSVVECQNIDVKRESHSDMIEMFDDDITEFSGTIALTTDEERDAFDDAVHIDRLDGHAAAQCHATDTNTHSSDDNGDVSEHARQLYAMGLFQGLFLGLNADDERQ